ncbi:MAG: arginine--tRNA ligase [Candidatus Aenigmatarchaeota archaeon]|nr:arginine--tRNA ligase [Candidatus Aenigmarchaeota archaeon]
MNLNKKSKQEIVKLLKKIDYVKYEDIESSIEVPAKKEFGDLSCKIAFQLAKKLRKNPNEIANEIAKKIDIKNSLFGKVEVVGAYINFFFNYSKISELTIKEIINKNKNYGKSEIGKGKKAMVEFSQPNPVHPMHIGHARTTLLGDALSNLLEFNGYNVIRANYMNDMGFQVSKLVTAYTLWGNNQKPKGKADLWLWDFYVKFHKEAKEKPELEEKAREMLRKFELEKDKHVSELWRKIVNWCIDGFKETYKKIGVDFDIYFYESDYRDLGKRLVSEALKRGVAFKSENQTIVADLEKHGLPNFVLLRSDGTGLYQTSDLGLTLHKFKKYNLDKSIWVVSSQQKLYFSQIFKTLELLGYKWVENCHHLSFEHVVLPEGKMSSREGRAIMLDQVIEELEKLALKETEKRNKLPEKKKRDIARKIAIGALRYAILKIDTKNLITFDWEKMLSFDGNTGPYIQYAYIRCKSILEKNKMIKKFKINDFDEKEKLLLKKLIEFPDVVIQAEKELKVNLICNYVYDLAVCFSEFYHSCPVLKAENEDKKNFRLSLTKSTKIVLENCFRILGIEAPEIM